ncbi:MAG: hypothetical protein ABMA26_15180 [Limisphaerales bacterium]
MTITTATYIAPPTVPGTIFELGAGYTDLQVTGADTGDFATVAFFYPDSITGAAEASLVLQFWDPTANGGSGGYVPVLGSGGANPVQTTTDGAGSIGGYFTVTLDNTSTPKITELSGTIFTSAPEPLPATPNILWEANGKLVPVTVNAPGYTIIGVTSNEPEGRLGSAWQVTGALTLKLRADRLGTGRGRIYTILLQAADGSQNVAVVRVPHDQGKK